MNENPHSHGADCQHSSHSHCTHTHSHTHSHTHTHTHSHSHQHSHNHSAGENIKTAFFLNFFFIFIEILGGIFTGSFAILSDAIHDLGDCAAIGCAYFLEKLSNKKSDEKYTYGYRRYSLVSAIITSAILLGGSVAVMAGAVMRINEPKEIYGLGMLIIAVFGVIINGLAVLKTSKGHGANEKAINLHLLEDVLGWVAVLIGSIFIYAFEFYFIDTLLSLIIAVFLLINSGKNLVEIFGVLLEKAPQSINVSDYKAEISRVEGVENAHHIHLWSLDGEDILATAHILAKPVENTDAYNRLKNKIEKISADFGITHLTLQIDFEENCSHDCGV